MLTIKRLFCLMELLGTQYQGRLSEAIEQKRERFDSKRKAKQDQESEQQ